MESRREHTPAHLLSFGLRFPFFSLFLFSGEGLLNIQPRPIFGHMNSVLQVFRLKDYGILRIAGTQETVYLRASLASMHSVACGTFINRSFGMSFPVVLHMP